ncbi:hypothetical protein LMCDFJHI_00677 [Aeromonas salmonicida]
MTDRNAEGTGDGGRCQLAGGDVAIVGDHFHPVVMGSQQGFDLRQRHVFFEFDGEGLAVATQGTDPHAQTIHRNGGIFDPQDLVGLGLALPLFAALAVVELGVNPGDEATGQRHAEVVHRQGA